MTDNMIEEAAKMYAFHKCDEKDIDQYDLDYLLENAFKAGINWFLNNLWHDVSEKPKEGKLVMVDIELSEEEIALGSIDKKVFVPDLSSIEWKELCELFGYTRWLYIEDLLKGGK